MIKFKAVVKMDSINDGIFSFVLNQIKIWWCDECNRNTEVSR